jgi:hypothetical protein
MLRTIWQKRVIGLILGLSLALIPAGVLAAGGKGKGAFGCGSFDQASVTAAAPGDTFMFIIFETGTGGPVSINKDLILQGGWSPIDTSLTCGGDAGGEFADIADAYNYFNFNPDIISPLPATDSGDPGPVLTIAPSLPNFLRIENIRFHDNSSDPALVGEITNGAEVTLENVIFENNAGGLDLVVRGGSRLVISNTQFIGNDTASGGAFNIEVHDTSEVIINNSQVLDNIAQSNGGGGRIVANDSSRVTISNSVFLGNQAVGNGGGLVLNGGPNTRVQVISSIFARNTAGGDGAGVRVNSGRVDIFHSTFAGPSLNPKQAIQTVGGTVQVKNSIIAQYAVGLRREAGTVIEDYNVYFSNTTHRSGAITSGGHSLDNANPRFNGPSSDNYRLGPRSAALDAGTNLGITLDFENNRRPLALGPDIGADERAFNKIGPEATAAGGPLNYSLILDQTRPQTMTYDFAKTAFIGFNSSGPASSYPDTLTVSGVQGQVKQVKVTLDQVFFETSGEVDILLVGPTGRAVVLLSDLTFDVGNSPTDQVVRLDDQVNRSLPNSSAAILDSGAYRPTNRGALNDPFAAPAPTAPYSTTLSAFNNLNPNGTWRLYIMNDEATSPQGGFINNWQLHFTTQIGEQITISDALQPGMNFIGSSGSGWSCNLSSGVVTCDRFDQVGANPVPVLKLSMAAPLQPGVITNTATLASNLPGQFAQNTIAVTTIHENGTYLPLILK